MTEVNVEGLNAVEKELRERPIQPLLRAAREAQALNAPIEVRSAHSSIEDVLKERGEVHGEFIEHASMTQALKYQMHGGRNWKRLSPIQAEGLEMIQHKIGRILAGDPNHKDHWKDIQGYAKLVEDRLP